MSGAREHDSARAAWEAVSAEARVAAREETRAALWEH